MLEGAAMASDPKPIDQDALAAEWGLSLEGETSPPATGTAAGGGASWVSPRVSTNL